MSEKKERLAVIRHSTAHVMAEAVLKLFPGSKVAIGPSIDNGFYYDFELSRPIKEEDLAEIEKEMRRIVSGNHDFERKVVSRDEALALLLINLTKLNLSMKCQRAKKSLSTLKMDTQIYVAVLTWLTQKKLTLKVSN